MEEEAQEKEKIAKSAVYKYTYTGLEFLTYTREANTSQEWFQTANRLQAYQLAIICSASVYNEIKERRVP